MECLQKLIILDCKKKFNKLQKVNMVLSIFFDLILHVGFNNKYRKKSNHSENTHMHSYTHSQEKTRNLK